MSARLGAWLLFACSACTAREACEDRADPYQPEGTTLSSSAFEGSALLGAAGERTELTFRGSLRGLPELWQGDSAILSGAALLSLSLAYESPPFGGDGVTEMPRVEARFTPPDSSKVEADRTPAFPSAEGSDFSSSFFETCSGDSGVNCCVYGARECSVLLGVTLERVDGTPFPPVVVDWNISASALVSTCPLGGETPELSFEPEGP